MAPSAVLLSCAAVALLLLHVVEAFPPHDNRIFGGHYINISDIPFQVAMLRNGNHSCGGSIISERWILSAAHCTFGINTKSLGIRVGSNKYASGGQYYHVEQVVNHEEYRATSTPPNDISLLKTSEPMVLSDKVAIARLPAQGAASPSLEKKLRVSGWGRSENAFPEEELKAVHVHLVDFLLNCKKISSEADENNQLCAHTAGQNSCSGDSGGPLADGDTVVGIVSYGPLDCGNFPVVYTRISAYRDWITNHTGV